MGKKNVNPKFNILRHIELPAAGVAARLSIDANGEVTIFGHDGNLVTPIKDERSTCSDRAKGNKYHSRVTTTNGYGSVSGLAELASLDSFFAIDTNTREIHGRRVSVAAFLQFKIVADLESGQRCVPCETHAHTFEFHDLAGNPEMLAILMVAMANLSQVNQRKSPGIGFITDSELGLHDAINSRQHPIYDNHLLPPGFSLIYASADKGKELTNVLLKTCDKHSGSLLDALSLSDVTETGFLAFPGLPAVTYGYRKAVIEAMSGTVGTTTLNPGSTIKIEFRS